MTDEDGPNLTSVTVEHLLGVKHGPLVKLRCEGAGVVLIGQLRPSDARKIAADLFEAAARAEYESDLYATMRRERWERRMIGAVLSMVRAGEEGRLSKRVDTTEGGQDDDEK